MDVVVIKAGTWFLVKSNSCLYKRGEEVKVQGAKRYKEVEGNKRGTKACHCL